MDSTVSEMQDSSSPFAFEVSLLPTIVLAHYF